ncbi:non-specific serine/threonine protein kinase [Decorospora gaudefroyi]|uniref:non-specific serine/threonine protein kinase n=1 Tax=Decorospora gaudefroyi TaxID=184978 RepID=A0A6A5KPW9_9PLEO|nr:non-specific serine/threonine protein kinase [Decorospora gaudefroyi]
MLKFGQRACIRFRFPSNISRISRFQSTKMNASELFEEEHLPWYSHDQFYPVRTGEVLDSSFKVIGKLGYGAYSTVWLCRDIRERDADFVAGYVAVKVCTRNAEKSTQLNRELEFYEHVSSMESQHRGQAYIRGLYGEFELDSPTGKHLCLVHPPMHMTIRQLQYQNPARKLNVPLLKWTLANVLKALSFLHDEAKVVHTDINPANIMLTVADETILEDFEKAEAENPSPSKVIDDTRTIYRSRKLRLPTGDLWGQPVLCDFGEARIGDSHSGLIQPELYRAPEVLFEMEWGPKVDIWSVATLVWDLFESRHLFDARDNEGKSSATHHIAEMVAYLGMPPLQYTQSNKITKKLFDEQGHWTGGSKSVTIPKTSLEERLSVLEGEEKELFLDFMRSMLRWRPEDRKSATELLQQPWMADVM